MDEYNFLLRNSRLIIETDDNIIIHFLENRDKFERLKYLAIEELDELFTYRNIDRSVELLTGLESESKKCIFHQFLLEVSSLNYTLILLLVEF